MILRIGERLRGSHHDALAGMDAQRVEVLHVTDGDAVVIAVAHHLVFYLLPSFQRLLHKHLRREGEGLFAQHIQLGLVIAEAAAQATQRVGGTHDDGIAQFGSRLPGLAYVLASLALDGLHIDFVQALHKQLAVFGIDDGLYGSAQHADTVSFQHTALIQLHAAVECRLPAKREQDAVGTLLLDDFLYEVGLDWQEIHFVGHALRGLHGSDIGVDEHRLDALFPQCLQSLRPRVVELAGLAYFQCTAAQQQHFLDILVFHRRNVFYLIIL